MSSQEVIRILKRMLLDEHGDLLRAAPWNWELAKYVEEKTGAIELINIEDVEVETDENDLPVFSQAYSYPADYKLKDREYLSALLREIEDEVFKIPDSINKFLAHSNNPKWVCQCGRFQGKGLISYEEIRALMVKFEEEKYWRCRSCGRLNYFKIDDSGVIHFETK
ncbi:MAG: hypothetical protein KGI50_01530 [Patescibacteria group bacterium]|nr:hypothetical protein [Patescibacteria group bacterium]MDE2437976.1 hypothetical protein [Patescibacteria group bacterium]